MFEGYSSLTISYLLTASWIIPDKFGKKRLQISTSGLYRFFQVFSAVVCRSLGVTIAFAWPCTFQKGIICKVWNKITDFIGYKQIAKLVLCPWLQVSMAPSVHGSKCSWLKCPWLKCPWLKCPWLKCPWLKCPWLKCPWLKCPWLQVSMAQVPMAQVPMAQVPMAQVPMAQVPMAQVPMAQVPMAQVPMAQVPMAQVPMAPSAHGSSAHGSSAHGCFLSSEWVGACIFMLVQEF